MNMENILLTSTPLQSGIAYPRGSGLRGKLRSLGDPKFPAELKAFMSCTFRLIAPNSESTRPVST